MSTIDDEVQSRAGKPKALIPVADQLAEQAAEIRRLSDALTRLSGENFRSAQHAMAPSPRAGDDISVFADNMSLTADLQDEAAPPLPSEHYDPLASLMSASPPNKPHDDLEVESDLYKDEKEIGPPLFEKLADRLTKAMTLPPQKSALDSIAEKYKTPSNARAACAPRVDPEIWMTLPGRTRAKDVATQKLQRQVVKGTLPYGLILQELNDISKGEKILDIGKLKGLALDGLSLAGNAVYELSMKRREDLKGGISPRYRGLCGRHTPLAENLFGSDLPAALKKVSDAYNIGQRVQTTRPSRNRHVSAGDRRRPYRETAPYYVPSRRHPTRDRYPYTGGRHTASATVSRPPFQFTAPPRAQPQTRLKPSGESKN